MEKIQVTLKELKLFTTQIKEAIHKASGKPN